jgi:hypothetical protein
MFLAFVLLCLRNVIKVSNLCAFVFKLRNIKGT